MIVTYYLGPRLEISSDFSVKIFNEEFLRLPKLWGCMKELLDVDAITM